MTQPEPREVGERDTPAAPAPSLPSIVRQMVLQPVVREVEREPPTGQDPAPPAMTEQPAASVVAGPAPEHLTFTPVAVPEPAGEGAALRPQRERPAAPPVLKPRAERVSAFPEAPPPAAPTIQVTIGRVEVRATSSPSLAPDKPRPMPVVMSLDDYLAQRAGGVG